MSDILDLATVLAVLGQIARAAILGVLVTSIVSCHVDALRASSTRVRRKHERSAAFYTGVVILLGLSVLADVVSGDWL